MKTLAPSLVSIAILLAAGSAAAFAQTYKWVDDSGRTHYSDKAPSSGRVDTVADKLSTYTAPEAPVTLAQPAAPASPELQDRMERLERQLYAEQLARRDAELAAYSEPQEIYYVPVGVGAPIRHPGHRFRRQPPSPGVVGPGVMPGTFNGPNAITAGNFTLRTTLPASRGRGTPGF